MIKVLLFDVSYTLLFPKDKTYRDELNKLHKELSVSSGYNFSDNFYLNMKQIDYLETLKGKYDLYVFTSGTIQNAPEIRPTLDKIFKKIYSAEEMGVSKKDMQSYLQIVDDLGVKPSEILFVDDTEKNVMAARSAGLNGVVYEQFSKLREDLKEMLSSEN